MKNKKVEMQYGSEIISLQLKDDTPVLSHTEPHRSVQSGEFREKLHSHLRKREKTPGTVGIVVCDKTRLCEYPLYLPMITGVLEEYGIGREDMVFYIAYGTHPVQTDEESLSSYGETYKQFRFVHHNSKDETKLVHLGTTSKGTEVQVLKDLFKHDLLITFGAILHHYFAGFGGGRKLLFPGLAGYDAILKNHSLFLHTEKKELRAGCQSGSLDTNPLASDLEEIDSMLPARLQIHAILNSKKEVCELYTGTTYAGYSEVCTRYDHYFRLGNEIQYNLVVASAGGYPKDINFIQAHKSIHNAASFVKDGGKLVIFAECRDGIGNQAFMNLFKLGGEEHIFEKMAVKYENNAGTALAMLEKSRRIKIHFVTSLDEETCKLMGAIKTSAEEAQQIIHTESGEMATIPHAGLIYKQA